MTKSEAQNIVNSISEQNKRKAVITKNLKKWLALIEKNNIYLKLFFKSPIDLVRWFLAYDTAEQLKEMSVKDMAREIRNGLPNFSTLKLSKLADEMQIYEEFSETDSIRALNLFYELRKIDDFVALETDDDKLPKLN